MRHSYKQTQNALRTRWVARVEELTLAINPTLRGKIDWTTATYLFTRAYSPEEAAEKLARD